MCCSELQTFPGIKDWNMPNELICFSVIYKILIVGNVSEGGTLKPWVLSTQLHMQNIQTDKVFRQLDVCLFVCNGKNMCVRKQLLKADEAHILSCPHSTRSAWNLI